MHPSHIVLEPTKDSCAWFLLLKFRTVHQRTPEAFWRKLWSLQSQGMVVQKQSESGKWTSENGKYLVELFEVLGFFCLFACFAIYSQTTILENHTFLKDLSPKLPFSEMKESMQVSNRSPSKNPKHPKSQKPRIFSCGKLVTKIKRNPQFIIQRSKPCFFKTNLQIRLKWLFHSDTASQWQTKHIAAVHSHMPILRYTMM